MNRRVLVKNHHQGICHDAVANPARASQKWASTHNASHGRKGFTTSIRLHKTIPREKLWHFLSCWGARPECGKCQAAGFDQTMPTLTQPTVSALHSTPSSGLGCVTGKHSHRKWELELFPSGTVCTVGKQGLIFSRKTKHSKLIQQTEILQMSWTNAIFSLLKNQAF